MKIFRCARRATDEERNVLAYMSTEGRSNNAAERKIGKHTKQSAKLVRQLADSFRQFLKTIIRNELAKRDCVYLRNQRRTFKKILKASALNIPFN